MLIVVKNVKSVTIEKEKSTEKYNIYFEHYFLPQLSTLSLLSQLSTHSLSLCVHVLQ